MIVDVELMSTSDIERYLIENADKLRKLGGKNGITKRVIAMAIGCYHDDRYRDMLYKKLDKVKCVTKSQSGRFTINIESQVPVDTDAMQSDPILSRMNDLLGKAFKIGPDDDLAINMGDDVWYQQCSKCIYYDSTKKWCDVLKERREGTADPCDDLKIRIDSKIAARWKARFKSKPGTQLKNGGVRSVP